MGGFNATSLSADLDSLEYNGVVQSGNIFDVLPTLEGSIYEKKIVIRNGKIDVTAFKGKELLWAKEHLEDAITEKLEDGQTIKKREDLGQGTNIVEEAIVNHIPYVPDDFNHIENTTIETGYVIVDKFGNEYVWVPVEDTRIFDGKINQKYDAYKDFVTDFNAMKNSIKIYGGFYIGRYEASNVNGKVATVKNNFAWNNIKWGESLKNPGNNGAYGLAKNVATTYNYSGFKSTLVYNSMWDATITFMNKSNDKNSLEYGNYNGSSFNVDNTDARGSKDDGKTFGYVANKSVNTRMLLTTGAVDRNCVKNIYDMAGNLSEWVIAPFNLNTNTVLVRGGEYSDLSNSVSIRYAVERNVSDSRVATGFRVALYI